MSNKEEALSWQRQGLTKKQKLTPGDTMRSIPKTLNSLRSKELELHIGHTHP